MVGEGGYCSLLLNSCDDIFLMWRNSVLEVARADRYANVKSDGLNPLRKSCKRKHYYQQQRPGDDGDSHDHSLEYILGSAIGSLCNHLRKV